VDFNRYAYSFNDPINMTDPNGHATFSSGTTFGGTTIYAGSDPNAPVWRGNDGITVNNPQPIPGQKPTIHRWENIFGTFVVARYPNGAQVGLSSALGLGFGVHSGGSGSYIVPFSGSLGTWSHGQKVPNTLRNIYVYPSLATQYAVMLQTARVLYPKLAGRIHLHHVVPKYLGGAQSGKVVAIDAAYHQLITNEFRTLWSYQMTSQGLLPTSDQLARIMITVYTKYPIP
jgi:hypothetical protein